MQFFWLRVTDRIRTVFSLDYRSLALLRIGVALTLILDLIFRAFDLRAFYSDAGVLPRAELLRLFHNDWFISLHMMSGAWQFEALLFIVAGVFALMLLVGYRTRLAAIASFILLISLHARNPLVLQGGDIVLRVMFFWMLFLPLGKRYSLDRLFNRVAPPLQKTFFSAATVAYILQICFLYIFTALLKTGIAWHHDGTAIYYALSIDQLVSGAGHALLQFPALMRALTHSVWYIELLAPFLLFIPWKNNFFRACVLVLLIGMQLGINICMHLGLFGTITVVTLLGLVPSQFWDGPWRRFRNWLSNKGKRGLAIYYDAECTFCQKTCFVLSRMLFLHPSTEIMPASVDPNMAALMEEKNSWVILSSKGTFFGWEGLAEVVRHSPVFFWKAPLMVMPGIADYGEKVYRLIAKRRLAVCLPTPIEKATSPWARTTLALVVSLLLVYVFVWNLSTLSGHSKLMPAQLAWIGYVTRLDQKFDMFAPTPLVEDGWYIFPGTLRDGTAVDAYRPYDKLSYAKPASVLYKNQRWQKYLMNLWAKQYSDYRLAYGKYVCREWNAHTPVNKQLMQYRIIFMLETTPPPGQPAALPVATTIWEHTCF